METNRSSEITAEWTVRAHLTITRPSTTPAAATIGDNDNSLQHVTDGYQMYNESVTPDRLATDTRNTDNIDNPIRVVYKWCSDDIKPSNVYSTDSNISTYGYAPLRQTNITGLESDTHGQHMTCNFQPSEITPPSDSGVDSSSTTNISNNKPAFIPRFRSTCNIILSASTELIQKSNEIRDDISTSCRTIHPTPEVLIQGWFFYLYPNFGIFQYFHHVYSSFTIHPHHSITGLIHRPKSSTFKVLISSQ